MWLAFLTPHIHSFCFWADQGRAEIQAMVTSVMGKLEIQREKGEKREEDREKWDYRHKHINCAD